MPTTSQISLPNPRTWAVDDLVTVPRLRADVTNAVAFLTTRPLLVAQDTSGNTWGSGSDFNFASLNSELTDNWDGHVTSAVNGATSAQYWAPVPGWYLARSTIAIVATPAAPFLIRGGFSGLTGGTAFGPVLGCLTLVGPASVSVTVTCQTCDLIEQVNSGSPGGSGDYINATFFQNSGSAITLNSAAPLTPTVSVRWACATSGTQPLPIPPLTTVPTPITSAWLNANVRDAIRFLTYPPITKAYTTSGFLASTTVSAPSAVSLPSVAVDNYGAWSTGTNLWTAPRAGVYLFYGQVNFGNSTTAATYGAGLSVNGGTTQWGDIVTFAPSAAQGGGASVTRRLRVNSGDTVALMACQNSGANLSYHGTAQTRLIAVWESS